MPSLQLALQACLFPSACHFGCLTSSAQFWTSPCLPLPCARHMMYCKLFGKSQASKSIAQSSISRTGSRVWRVGGQHQQAVTSLPQLPMRPPTASLRQAVVGTGRRSQLRLTANEVSAADTLGCDAVSQKRSSAQLLKGAAGAAMLGIMLRLCPGLAMAPLLLWHACQRRINVLAASHPVWGGWVGRVAVVGVEGGWPGEVQRQRGTGRR